MTLEETINAMDLSQIKARRKDIQSQMEKDDANIDELIKEVDLLEKREKEINDDIEKRSKLKDRLSKMNLHGNAQPTVAETPKTGLEARKSIEYRKAFMEYVQKGTRSDVLQYEQRDAAQGVAADLGVLLPETIIQTILEELKGKYGQLYNKVSKWNFQGGVKVPIGAFGASFKRITETTVSENQKAGAVTGYVQFTYNIGEIRVARTLLQEVLSVDVFEQKVANVIVEAYVKAMDEEIMVGEASKNQCEGILTEAAKADGRIKADHVIEFTDADMKDWKTWQTKLFAIIPLEMRGESPEFVMTPNTYEANIKTLVDDNNRPVYSETYNPVDGAETSRFKGHEVTFVEDSILKSFNDAKTGEYFGMYWVPEKAYAINTNMQFSMYHYFDHDTNQYIDKALVINDGKVLDPKYLYLLKKKVTG